MRQNVREGMRENMREREYAKERTRIYKRQHKREAEVGRGQLSITRKKQHNSSVLISAPFVCSLARQGLKFSQQRYVVDMVKDCLAFCSESK